MRRYSFAHRAWNALHGQGLWQVAWRTPTLEITFDAVVIRSSRRVLSAAYYLARKLKVYEGLAPENGPEKMSLLSLVRPSIGRRRRQKGPGAGHAPGQGVRREVIKRRHDIPSFDRDRLLAR
jgi:hypothetical protein